MSTALIVSYWITGIALAILTLPLLGILLGVALIYLGHGGALIARALHKVFVIIAMTGYWMIRKGNESNPDDYPEYPPAPDPHAH